MKKSTVRLTTAQFANLHEVNRRTLHYYDNIGLFSPSTKGENGYRYYDLAQSIEFEYIRMLKGLNMSIEEIRAYVKNPGPDEFLAIAGTKEKEIECQIRHLLRTKKVLREKSAQIEFCKKLNGREIRIIKCAEEKLSVLPYDFADDDISEVFSYVKGAWSIEQIRGGIGGIIGVDKVAAGNFDFYDGIYAKAENTAAVNLLIKPSGQYLCGWQRGTWDRLPELYREMLAFAKNNSLELTGYAYEIGLNEFVIASPDDYVTQIMIKICE